MQLVSLFVLSSEARREARKAFLALSSNDAKAQHVDSEQFEHDIHPIDLPADDDTQYFKSTPVRLPLLK